MWENQMVVGHREPQLFLEPGELFGKPIGTTRQAPITLTLGQVVPLHEAGVDGVADGRICQSRGDHVWISEDNLGTDFDNTTFLAFLNNLSIQ